MDKTLSDMTSNEFDASLIDLMEEAGLKPLPVRPPGYGITRNEYAEREKCSRNHAQAILDSAVQKGVLEVTEMRHGKGTTNVYHRPA